MKRIFLLEALLLINFFLGAIANITKAQHFIPVWTGNGVDHMNFYALSATLDDIDLQPGDEIAVFDGDYCVLNFVRKKRGELIKEDLFVCSGCGVAVEEKPGKVCLNCGKIPGRVRKRNLDNFLEDRVYRR